MVLLTGASRNNDTTLAVQRTKVVILLLRSLMIKIIITTSLVIEDYILSTFKYLSNVGYFCLKCSSL